MFVEFLESSTIHGLAHISRAKSRSARLAWMAIVLASFSIAIAMITSSYKEWQESPVSTTIITHPITELEFPAITVCPPRGSNTAMNFLLEKVENENFTDDQRQKLKDIAREVFIEIPNKKQASQMMELLSKDNMRSIYDDMATLPEIDEKNVVTLRFQEPQGSVESPGFGDPKYNGDFYRKKQSLRLVLEISNEILRETDIVLSVQTEGSWSYRFEGKEFQLHNKNSTMAAAEGFCASQGGHLASVGSSEEHSKVTNSLSEIAFGSSVWLGGRRDSAGWKWLDGQAWTFEKWFKNPSWPFKTTHEDQPSDEKGEDCLALQSNTWWDEKCSNKFPFICSYPTQAAQPPTVVSGNQSILMEQPRSTQATSTFYFWWSHDLDSKRLPGFQLNWWTENRDNPGKSESESNTSLGSGNQTNPARRKRLALPTYWNQSTHLKPKNAKWVMVNLARTCRLQNKTEELRLATLKRRWSLDILESSPCLNEVKITFVIEKISMDLNLTYKNYSVISDEDLELGFELFSYLHYCQSQVVEAAQLSAFFEMLLSNYDLKTVVASTMNNIQPRVGDNLQDLTAMNMWFEQLDKKFNFSLVPVLLPLSTRRELEKLRELDPPFLKMYNDKLDLCIRKNDCKDLLTFTGNKNHQNIKN